jgi:Arc/MetJ-type ribon-helix-helix transcriptional regulator
VLVWLFSLVRGVRFSREGAGTVQFWNYYPSRKGVVTALKISAGLPAEDVEFLDSFRRANGFRSRSSVLHLAIFTLQGAQLTSSFEAAWAEWADTPESVEWAAASPYAPSDPEPREPD